MRAAVCSTNLLVAMETEARRGDQPSANAFIRSAGTADEGGEEAESGEQDGREEVWGMPA